jgi:phosphoesterase RecJ-like protein
MKLRVTDRKTEDTTRRVEIFNRIEELLKAADRILIVTHIDPDGDALGTQLAFGAYLEHLGKDVCMVRDSQIPRKYRFLPGIENIDSTETIARDYTADAAIVLECPNLNRLGKAERLLDDVGVIINIDHHQDNLDLGHINWVDIAASSVGEMVYEFFRHVHFSISANVATHLYTAILTDTGRFRYASTTPRSMQIAARLIESGADPRRICDTVYYNMPPSTMTLTGKVLGGIRFFHNDMICILTLTNEMLIDSGADLSESDGLVDFTLFSEGVQAGALLKEIDDSHTKVSLRAVEGLDVAEVAAEFGGGGHVAAAGCTVPASLEDARKKIVTRLIEVVNGTD